jgi:hypothetical protein
VKIIANNIVTINPEITLRERPKTKAVCAQVKAAPEVKRRFVFKNGISQGLITSIPLGGQIHPISGTGFKLA